MCGECGVSAHHHVGMIRFLSEGDTDRYFASLSMFCSSRRRQSTFSVDKFGDVYKTKWFYSRSVNIYWSLHDMPRVIFGHSTVGFFNNAEKALVSSG